MRPGQDVGQQLGDVAPGRRDAAAQPDVAEDDGLDRDLDVVRRADRARRSARPGDRERRRHRFAGPDALEGRLDAEPAGHLANGRDGRVAPLRDDVRRTELAGDRLAGRVAATAR